MLAQSKRKPAEVAERVAEIESINNGLHVLNVGEMSTRPTTIVTVKRKDHKFKNTLFIHCKHEARLEGLKRYIHEIDDSIFKNTDFHDIRRIVGHQNNPDYDLKRKRPPAFLLKDQPKKKSKYFSIDFQAKI